ncbi:PA14 domain-containing protein [Bacillus sp. 3103sda1]|uniref:PA14 domain-containing protein n=1 Tax=Bacillus sp. 3103sda1 TaxID=2953808 RepID=UPI0020A10C83|nr:PA14 domain-containing protein [Bacillus sp. 3103sda1]MCP1124257.1 PA14 domain-containing protein [Bacillus sp. 3103sda1]
MCDSRKKTLFQAALGIAIFSFFALPSIGSAESNIYKQEGGEVHYNWGYEAPAGVQNDNFTAQFNQSRSLNAGDYFVHTLADDRVKVSFDGKQVINRWYDVGGQIDRAIVTNVPQGDHKIQTDFYENGGQAAVFSDIVPFDSWLAYYYPNTNLDGYPVDAKVIAPQGTEKSLIENSGDGSPTPKVPANNFSARYTTVKRLPAGEYIVRGKADDGMRVLIDGKLVIDEWNTGKWDTEHARKITIQDNTASWAFGTTNEKDTHLVEVQYLELGGGSNVSFNIQPYGQAVQHDTWTAEYYNNTNLAGDAVVVAGKNSKDRIDTINFDWKDGSPHPNIKSDNFSARFTKVQDFKSGDYYCGGIVDDGMRVYLDDKLIIDNWGGGYDKIYAKKVPITEGKHKVTVEYLELTGGANLKFNIESYSQAIQQSTWTAEYFNNPELKGDPVHIAGKTAKDKIDKLEFDWKDGSPHKNVPVDNFSIRYTKVANFDEGEYYFDGITDDGVRVYLDDKLIIDNWGAGDNKLYAKNHSVTSGKHKITVEYLEITGGAKFSFNYNTERICKKINPNVQRASISTAELKNNEEQLNANSENVNAVSSENAINLSWNKRNVVAKYKLHKLNDDDKWEEIWNGTDTHYTVANLESSNAYTLKLISYDNNDNILSESKINAFTLNGNNVKQQYSQGLQSAPKSNVNSVATDESKLVYPMTDAYINSVESGGMTKLTWGNVPTDDNVYEVYRNGQYVTTTNKNEFIDTPKSVIQRASIDSETSTADDPYRTYYDIKSVKQIPSNKVEEKVNTLKASGVTPTNHQKEELGCEEKKLSTYVDKPGWSAPAKSSVSSESVSSYDLGYTFRYQTFIPAAYPDAPWYIPNIISDFKTFKGDNRNYFTYFSDKYRTRLDVTVTWKHSMNGYLGTSAEFKSIKKTGLTTGYKKDGTAVDGKANAERDLNMSVVLATSKRAEFTMETASANPLVPGAPTIDAFAYVIVNRNGSGATAGFHDKAPNHEFYRALYSSVKPEIDNTTTLHTARISSFFGFTALFPGVSTVEFVTAYPRLVVD